jgi:hypothetical protein
MVESFDEQQLMEFCHLSIEPSTFSSEVFKEHLVR